MKNKATPRLIIAESHCFPLGLKEQGFYLSPSTWVTCWNLVLEDAQVAVC